MTEHIENWVGDWLAGSLSNEQERQFEEHLEECEACGRKLTELRRDLADLGAGGPADAAGGTPSAELREQILEGLEPEARFLDLLDDVADFLDVPPREARRLLAAIDESSNWVPVPGKNIAFFYLPFISFETGEGVDARFASIVRVERGAEFPEHRHMGREWVFMLQGTMCEDDGEVYHRGDTITHADDTAHTFRVPEDSPALVGIVLVEEGLEIEGIPLGSSG